MSKLIEQATKRGWKIVTDINLTQDALENSKKTNLEIWQNIRLYRFLTQTKENITKHNFTFFPL